MNIKWLIQIHNSTRHDYVLENTKRKMKFRHFLFHNLTTADGDKRNKVREPFNFHSALLDTPTYAHAYTWNFYSAI